MGEEMLNFLHGQAGGIELGGEEVTGRVKRNMLFDMCKIMNYITERLIGRCIMAKTQQVLHAAPLLDERKNGTVEENSIWQANDTACLDCRLHNEVTNEMLGAKRDKIRITETSIRGEEEGITDTTIATSEMESRDPSQLCARQSVLPGHHAGDAVNIKWIVIVGEETSAHAFVYDGPQAAQTVNDGIRCKVTALQERPEADDEVIVNIREGDSWTENINIPEKGAIALLGTETPVRLLDDAGGEVAQGSRWRYVVKIGGLQHRKRNLLSSQQHVKFTTFDVIAHLIKIGVVLIREGMVVYKAVMELFAR